MFLKRGPNSPVAWWTGLVVIVPTFIYSYFIPSLVGHVPKWMIFTPFVLLGGVPAYVVFKCSRTLSKKLDSADGRLCVYCRYSLRDLPSPGKCPECGREFPLDGYASVWKRYRQLPVERMWHRMRESIRRRLAMKDDPTGRM